jgi:Putative adhesin
MSETTANEESTMQTFDTPAAISAVLGIPAGRIQVIAADRADTTVEVLPANASKGRDVKAAEQTTVEFTDGVLRIKAPAGTNQILGPSGSVEVTVQLPAGSSIEATASCAEFRGVGRLGDVACEGAHGAVKIDEATRVRVATSAGDVTIGRLTGPAEISTQKGDIHIAEATSGTVVLHTQMGDVTVGAAHGVSASLDAGTGYGRIDNALQNPDGAAAGLTIHATTDYGDITARSL